MALVMHVMQAAMAAVGWRASGGGLLRVYGTLRRHHISAPTSFGQLRSLTAASTMALISRCQHISPAVPSPCGRPRSLSAFSTGAQPYRSVKSLMRDVQEAPGDPLRQVRLLRKIEEEGGADAVLAYVEALPNPHLGEEVVREYLRALRKVTTRPSGFGTSQGDATQIDPVHERSNPAWGGQAQKQSSASPWDTSMFFGGRFSGGAGGTGDGGQAVHVAMAEPTPKEQVFRTLRTLAAAYLLLLGITTIMEERGLVKGMSSGSEMGSTKAAESTKTFKGPAPLPEGLSMSVGRAAAEGMHLEHVVCTRGGGGLRPDATRALSVKQDWVICRFAYYRCLSNGKVDYRP